MLAIAAGVGSTFSLVSLGVCLLDNNNNNNNNNDRLTAFDPGQPG